MNDNKNIPEGFKPVYSFDSKKNGSSIYEDKENLQDDSIPEGFRKLSPDELELSLNVKSPEKPKSPMTRWKGFTEIPPRTDNSQANEALSMLMDGAIYNEDEIDQESFLRKTDPKLLRAKEYFVPEKQEWQPLSIKQAMEQVKMIDRQKMELEKQIRRINEVSGWAKQSLPTTPGTEAVMSKRKSVYEFKDILPEELIDIYGTVNPGNLSQKEKRIAEHQYMNKLPGKLKNQIEELKTKSLDIVDQTTGYNYASELLALEHELESIKKINTIREDRGEWITGEEDPSKGMSMPFRKQFNTIKNISSRLVNLASFGKVPVIPNENRIIKDMTSDILSEIGQLEGERQQIANSLRSQDPEIKKDLDKRDPFINQDIQKIETVNLKNKYGEEAVRMNRLENSENLIDIQMSLDNVFMIESEGNKNVLDFEYFLSPSFKNNFNIMDSDKFDTAEKIMKNVKSRKSYQNADIEGKKSIIYHEAKRYVTNKSESIESRDKLEKEIMPYLLYGMLFTDNGNLSFTGIHMYTQNTIDRLDLYLKDLRVQKAKLLNKSSKDDPQSIYEIVDYGKDIDREIAITESSMENLEKIMKMNPDESWIRKAGHGLTSVPAHELLSLGITEMGNQLGIMKLANDVSKGYIPSYSEQKMLEAYSLMNMANSSGEKLGWYRVGQGITRMVPYIAQFGLTSGAGTAVKKGTEVGVKKAVKATAGKKMYGKLANSMQFKLSPVGKKVIGTTKDVISMPELAVKSIGYTTGAAGQASLMFPMYTRTFAESQTSNINLTFGDGIDDMMIAIDGNTTTIGKSLKSSAIQSFSEVFTERLGPHIMKSFGIAGRSTKYAATGAVNEPAKRFLATRLAGVKSRMNPKVQDANTFIRKGLGWNTVPEEYFEEVANYFMVAGLEGNEVAFDQDFFQEQLETLGIVSIFGTAMGSINIPATIQEIKYGEGVLFKYKKPKYDNGEVILDNKGNSKTETIATILPDNIYKDVQTALKDKQYGHKINQVLLKYKKELSKEQVDIIFQLLSGRQIEQIMEESLPENFKELSKKEQEREREVLKKKAEYEQHADFNRYMMEKQRDENLLDKRDQKQRILENKLKNNEISQEEFNTEVEKANSQLRKNIGLEEPVEEKKKEKETPATMEYKEGVSENNQEIELTPEETQKIEEENQVIVKKYPGLYKEGLLERDQGGQFIEPSVYDLAQKAKELTIELRQSTKKDEKGNTIFDNEHHIDLINKIGAIENELRDQLGIEAGSFNDLLTPHKFEIVFSEVMAGKQLKGRIQKPAYSQSGFEVILEDGRMVKAFQDQRQNKKVLEKFNTAIKNNEKVSLNIIPKSQWNADNKAGYIENGIFIPYGDKVSVTLEDGTIIGSLALRFQDEVKEREKRYNEVTRKEQMHLDNALAYFGIRKPTSQAIQHGEPVQPNLQKGLEELAKYIVELMRRTGMDIRKALAQLKRNINESARTQKEKDFYSEAIEKYEDEIVSKALKIIVEQDKKKSEAAAEKASFTFAPENGVEKEGDVLNEQGKPHDSQTLTAEQRMLNSLKNFAPLWEAIAEVADTSKDNVELAFYRMAKDPRWKDIKTKEDYDNFIISFKSSAPAFTIAEDIGLRNHIVDVITNISFDKMVSAFVFYSNVTLTKNLNVILKKGNVKINSANSSGQYQVLLDIFIKHLDTIDMQHTKYIILKNNNIAYNFQRNQYAHGSDEEKREFRFRKHEEDLQILQSITGIPADTWREYFEYQENNERDEIIIDQKTGRKHRFESYDEVLSQDTFRKGYPRLQSNLMFALQQQQELQNATSDLQIRDALIKFFTKGFGSIKSNLFKLATSLDDEISIFGIDVKNDRFSSFEMASHLSETAHNIRKNPRSSKLRDYYRTLDKDAQIIYIKGIVDYDNNQDTSGHDPSRMTANDIFFTLMQQYALEDNYQQHMGQFADKDRIATIQVPKHRDPSVQEILDLKKIFPDFEDAVDHIYKILIRPIYIDYFARYQDGTLIGPASTYDGNTINLKLKSFAKEFVYNYAIWIKDINNVFHGDLAQYKGLTNMIKRGGVLNSPGMVPHQNIEGGVGKQYRVLVINDKRPETVRNDKEETFDGFSFMSGSSGTNFAGKTAVSIGSIFSKLDEYGIFDSVKMAHSGINPENNLRGLMKTNNVNIDAFDNSYGKSPLLDMIRGFMKKYDIDVITFTSGNKQMEFPDVEAPSLYNSDGSLNLKMKVNKKMIITRETKNLFIQQDLRHSSRPIVRSMLTQLPTNLYNLKYSSEFEKIINNIRDIQYREFKDSLKDKTLEDIRNEVLNKKSDRHSNPHLARMLSKGYDGMEPGMRKFAEIIFASNTGKDIMSIPVNRITTQEIPDFDKKLQGLRQSKTNPSKNLLPEISTNLPGGRVYNDYFKGFPEKAIDHVKANKERHQDLFDENNQLMTWEIYDANGGIPGEIILSNRVPGDDLHAHIVGRLKYNLSKGNFTMLDTVSRLTGGSDYDGDSRFNQVFFKDKNGGIIMNNTKEGLANQYMKYMALSYMDPDAQDRIDSAIDTEAYDDIIKKLEQMPEYKSVDLRAYMQSWAMNIVGVKMKGIMTHLNTVSSIAEQLKLPLNDIILPWNSNKILKNVVNDKWGIIKTHISNFQNMAFDNGKDPKIERMALNEITANMYVLAIISDPTLDSKNFKNSDDQYDAVDKAIEENAKYFTSKLVRRFVDLVREKNSGIGSSLMKDVWKKLKESGYSDKDITKLKNFYNKAQDLYAIRQLYNYTQKIPITPTEVIELGYLIYKFKENNYSLFDSKVFFDDKERFSGPFKHVQSSYDVSIEYIFRDSPELSLTGNRIISKIEERFYQAFKSKYPLFASHTKGFFTRPELDQFSRHFNNLIAVRAINNTDSFFEVSKKAIDALKQYQSENPTNLFTSKLQISHPIKKGTIIENTNLPLEISTVPDFRNVHINEYDLKNIHDDFAGIPEELKDILTAYAFHKYGTANARQNGGFYFFMDDAHKNAVSEKIKSEITALNTDVYEPHILQKMVHYIINASHTDRFKELWDINRQVPLYNNDVNGLITSEFPISFFALRMLAEVKDNASWKAWSSKYGGGTFQKRLAEELGVPLTSPSKQVIPWAKNLLEKEIKVSQRFYPFILREVSEKTQEGEKQERKASIEIVQQEQLKTTIDPKVDLSIPWKSGLDTRPVFSEEGINTMRTSGRENEHEHFGNPFSEGGYAGTIKVLSVEMATELYGRWLQGESFVFSDMNDKVHNTAYINQEQKEWILEQINSGKLDNANLLYDKKLYNRGKGSHADELARIIKDIRTEDQPIQRKPVKGTEKGTLSDDVIQDMAMQDGITEVLLSSDEPFQNFILNELHNLYPTIEFFQDRESFYNFVFDHGGSLMDVSITAIGHAFKNAAFIDPDTAVQSTPIHETAHIYWDSLPNDDDVKKQLIQMYKRVPGNEDLHGNLIKEKIILDIGRMGVDQADVKWKGNSLQKFVELLKRFWTKVKKALGVYSSTDLVSEMAYRVLTNRDKITPKTSMSRSALMNMIIPMDPSMEMEFDKPSGTIALGDMKFTSVSRVLKSLEVEPFNEHLQATTSASKAAKEFRVKYHKDLPDNDLQYEVDSQKLKWERDRDKGIAIHAAIAEVFGGDPVMEHYINDNFRSRKVYQDLRQAMIDLKSSILKKYPNAEFFPEHQIFSMKYKVSGIVDLKVNIEDKKVIIIDFKTTRDPFVKEDGSLMEHYTQQHGPLRAPLAEGVLYSKKLGHELQTGIYAAIIEEMGETIEGIFINPIIKILGNEGKIQYAMPASEIHWIGPGEAIIPDKWENMVSIKWKNKNGDYVPGYRDRILEILKQHSISEEKLDEFAVKFKSAMLNNNIFPTVAETMVIADRYFKRLAPDGNLLQLGYRDIETVLNGGEGITKLISILSQQGFQRDDFRGPKAMSTEELFFSMHKEYSRGELIENKNEYFPTIPVLSKYELKSNPKHDKSRTFYYKKVIDKPKIKGKDYKDTEGVEYKMREIGGHLIAEGNRIVEIADFQFSDGTFKEYASTYEVVGINSKYQYILVKNEDTGDIMKRDIVNDESGFLKLINEFPKNVKMEKEYFEPAFLLEKEETMESHMKRLTLSDFNNTRELQSYELNIHRIDNFFNEYDTLEKLRAFVDNENALNDFLTGIRFMLGVNNANTHVTALYNWLAGMSAAHIYAKYIRMESKSSLNHVRPMTLNAFHEITNNSDTLTKNLTNSMVEKFLSNARMVNAKYVRLHSVTHGLEYAWRFAHADQNMFREDIDKYLKGKFFNMFPGKSINFERLVTKQYGGYLYKRPGDNTLSEIEDDFLTIIYEAHYKYNPRYNQLKRSEKQRYPERIKVASVFMMKNEIKAQYGWIQGKLWGATIHRLIKPKVYDHIQIPIMDIVNDQLVPTGDYASLKDIKDQFIIEKGNTEMRRKYLGNATIWLPLRQSMASFTGFKKIVSLFGKAKMGLLEYYDQQAKNKFDESYSEGGVEARLKKSSVPSIGQNKVAHESSYKLEGEAKSIESLIYKYYMKDIVPVKDYMNYLYTSHEGGNVQKFLDTTVDAIIYKQKPGAFASDSVIAQSIDGMMQLNSLNKIAWQMYVQTKNLAIGLGTNLVAEPLVFARGVARLGIHPKDIFNFNKINPVKGKFNVFDGKILHLMKKFDIVTAAEQPKFDTLDKRMKAGMGGKMRPSLYGTMINAGYLPMQVAETIIQMFMFAGAMTEEEYNAYDNQGNLKPGQFKNRLTAARVGQVHDLIRSLHGDYTPIFAAPEWIGHGGAMIMQFRKWYPAMGQRIFAPYHFDRNYDLKAGVVSTIGLIGLIFNYNTKNSQKRKEKFENVLLEYKKNDKHLDFHFFSKLTDYMDYLIKETQGGKIKIKNLSKRDINNLRHAMIFFVTRFIARLIIAAIDAQGDDDWEFKSNTFWHTLEEYLEIYSQQVFAVVSLKENEQLMESPIPILNIPQAFLKFLKEIGYAVKKDPKGTYDRDTPYGLKGQKKFWLTLTHLVPAGSEARRQIKNRNIRILKRSGLDYEKLGVSEEQAKQMNDAFMRYRETYTKQDYGTIDELSKYDAMFLSNEKDRLEKMVNRGVKAKQLISLMQENGMIEENASEGVIKDALVQALLYIEKNEIVEDELKKFNKAYQYLLSKDELKSEQEIIDSIMDFATIEREAEEKAKGIGKYKRIKIANKFEKQMQELLGEEETAEMLESIYKRK